jgi:hypothetical protein
MYDNYPPGLLDYAPADFRRLGYEVWLPDDDHTGCIRAYPRPTDSSVRFLLYNCAGTEREIEDTVTMLESGMGSCLTELGYTAEYTKETRTGYATYPSSEYLAWRLTAPSVEKGLGLPIFIIRSGDSNFGMIEATQALARGGVLLSDSTRRFKQWPNDEVTESYTIMGHDVLSHAPGWLSLPPQIFAEFVTAAQDAMQAYYAASDRRSKTDAEQRIREIQSYIDSTVSSPTLHYLGQNIQTPGDHVGKNICTIIGPNARLRPAQYERLIYDYMQNPVALRSVLERGSDTQIITIARCALNAA